MRKILFLLSFLLSAIFADDFANFKKACGMGNAYSCAHLGLLYENAQGVKRDFKKAKEYFAKACDLKEQIGCNNYKRVSEKVY
jgi:TPR repeat protein